MLETMAELAAQLISFLFGFMDGVDLSPISNALDKITPFIKGALYFLPTETIAQIFAITCAIWSLRIVIKTLKLIWDIIPWL